MQTPNADPLSTSKGKAAEMGQKVADKIDENRGTAASGLETAASALREKADTLPGGNGGRGRCRSRLRARERCESHDDRRAETREEQSRCGFADRRGTGILDSTNILPRLIAQD